jgi:hypothetical protein
MTYDPELDEPKYSRRELLAEIRSAFIAGWEAWMDLAAGTPLQVYGRWEQGRVYDVSSMVFKDGRQWISTVQTASEPSENNAAWKLVHVPRIKEKGADE